MAAKCQALHSQKPQCKDTSYFLEVPIEVLSWKLSVAGLGHLLRVPVTSGNCVFCPQAWDVCSILSCRREVLVSMKHKDGNNVRCGL